MDDGLTQVELVRACAWCRRVEHNGAWIAPGRSVGPLQFAEQRAVSLTHTVCPPCFVRVQADCLRQRAATMRREAAG